MSHQVNKEKVKIPRHHGGAFNPRSISMPIAAVVMAGVLYTYSVSSIRAAKRNAQLHREADGGQLDMRKESLRRHGVLDPVAGTQGYDLFRKSGPESQDESQYLTEKKAKALGSDQSEERANPRTNVESSLEIYKGAGASAAVKKFKEAKQE